MPPMWRSGSLGSVALSLDTGAHRIQQNAVALKRQIHKIRFIHKLWDVIKKFLVRGNESCESPGQFGQPGLVWQED